MRWVSEIQSKGLKISFRVKRRLYRKKTAYQLVEVFDTIDFGRLLMLDRKVMLTERDEFIYHEMLVHPVVSILGGVTNVLVIGGGDGGTVRELLKYSPKRITLVEIDNVVVEVSKRFFPSLSSGLIDSRVQIQFMDGAEFVKESSDKFDLVIVDSTDPVGPGEVLFSDEFLRNVSRITDTMVSQSESPFLHRDIIKDYHRRIKKYFRNVFYYTAPIPSYPSGIWSFTIGTEKGFNINFRRSYKYYTPDVFQSALKIPPVFKIDE